MATASKRIAKQVLLIGENRVELLLVELQEERERLLLAILLALGVAVFGLLAGIALTLAVAVAFWEHSPLIALFVLMAIYVITAFLLYGRLAGLKKDWQTLPATLDQLRKDRACLERTLG
ncbi:MAG: phage holin family protein [Gloeobacteraceae cyanobacterium ES-bin-144]|nr:phage holin family protein [Verrucomicrobiales bacterium]